MDDIVLSEIFIYPLKSARGLAQQTAKLDRFGLANDRRWMLVDENRRFLSQREHARLCLIDVALTESGISITLPDQQSIQLSQHQCKRMIQVDVWHDRVEARDAGEDAAAILSDFLQQSVRLVHFPENAFRQCDLQYAREGEGTAFADGFPLLLITQSALDDLNQRLPQAVSMNRFRANLVVTGAAAHAEDQWKRITIGDTEFRLVKPCSRCVVPSIDPNTAQKDSDILKTLAEYRRWDGKIFFGQNVVAESNADLSVGMPVRVLE